MKAGSKVTIRTGRIVIAPSIETNIQTASSMPISASKRMLDQYQNSTDATSVSAVNATALPEVIRASVGTPVEIVAGRQFFDDPADYINRIVNSESDADSDYWQRIDVDTYIVRAHVGIDRGIGERQREQQIESGDERAIGEQYDDVDSREREHVEQKIVVDDFLVGGGELSDDSGGELEIARPAPYAPGSSKKRCVRITTRWTFSPSRSLAYTVIWVASRRGVMM